MSSFLIRKIPWQEFIQRFADSDLAEVLQRAIEAKDVDAANKAAFEYLETWFWDDNSDEETGYMGFYALGSLAGSYPAYRAYHLRNCQPR